MSNDESATAIPQMGDRAQVMDGQPWWHYVVGLLVTVLTVWIARGGAL